MIIKIYSNVKKKKIIKESLLIELIFDKSYICLIEDIHNYLPERKKKLNNKNISFL